MALDFAAQRRLVQTRALAQGARAKGHVGGDGLLRAGRQGLHIAGDIFAAELVDNALEGQVERLAADVDFDFERRAVQQALHFRAGVVGQFFVVVEQTGLSANSPAPGVEGIVREQQRALVEGFGGVQKSFQIYADLAAEAAALRTDALHGIE